MINEFVVGINKLLTIANQIDFGDHLLFLGVCCFLLASVLFSILKTYSFVELIVYMSLLSIIIVLIYLCLDSPDVAMTEAAIGVCLSTIIYLKVLPKLGKSSSNKEKNKLLSLISIIALTYVLIIAGMGLYEYGTNENQFYQHIVTKHYVENTGKEIGINSLVAAILASYRGFDTLFETLVIFTAGIIVTLLINNKHHESK